MKHVYNYFHPLIRVGRPTRKYRLVTYLHCCCVIVDENDDRVDMWMAHTTRSRDTYLLHTGYRIVGELEQVQR